MVPKVVQKGVADATRRRFLAVSAAAGFGSTLFPGALLGLAATEAAAQSGTGDADQPKITEAMIEAAAGIAGVSFTAEQRKMMLDNLNGQREDILEVRKMALPNSVEPSLVQDPVLPGMKLETERRPAKLGPAPSVAGLSASNEEAVAFATVRQLGTLLRAKKTTSVELTKLYLARLKRYDPSLHFVINLTE